MVDAIIAAVDAVHMRHPNRRYSPLAISLETWWTIPTPQITPIRRDADIGYYLKVGHNPKRLKLARTRTLDVPRTWTLSVATR